MKIELISKTISLLLIFILCMATCISLFACKPYVHEYEEGYVMPHSDIRVDIGLGHEFTVLHTSDTHLTLAEKTDTLNNKRTATSRKQYFDHQEEKLDYIAAFARENGYPITHSGDLIDFITDGNINKATAFLQDPNNDILAFSAGNHEFVQDFGADEDAAYKNQSLPKITAMSDRDMRFCVTERSGVTFITIDDSYHLIDADQLSKLKEAVNATSNPVVLVMHAPLYEENLYNLMLATSDSAYVLAAPEEKLATYSEHRYNEQKADATTYEAYDYIVGEPKIRAILTGHVHRDFISYVRPDLVQIIATPSFFRLVTFY